jgi:hypothetical protein
MGLSFLRSWDSVDWLEETAETPGQVLCLSTYEGELLVGGAFSQIDGVVAHGLARRVAKRWEPLVLDGDGILPDFAGYSVTGTPVVGMLPMEQELLVYGSIVSAGLQPSRIAALWDGDRWTSYDLWHELPAEHEYIWATGAVRLGDDLLVGIGRCPWSGGSFSYSLARWTETGWETVDDTVEPAAMTNFGDGMALAFEKVWLHDGEQATIIADRVAGVVRDLAVFDTLLVAAGYFDAIDDVQTNHIAVWDGQSWHGIGGIGGYSEQAFVLEVHDGRLIVGGLFSQPGGVTAANIAAWDGENWSPLGRGIDGSVAALLSDGHRLYAGGTFLQAGAVPAGSIAYWQDGTWRALGSGVDLSISALARHEDYIYVGGYFLEAGGKLASHFSRWQLASIPVALQAFTAERTGAGARLAWQLAQIGSAAELNLWREEPPSQRRLLNTKPLPVTAGNFFDPHAPLEEIRYGLQQIDSEGGESWLGWTILPEAPTSQAGPSLTRIQPNPFNPSTSLHFELPRATPVRLEVYDLRGRRVRILMADVLPAGEHAVDWDGSDEHGRPVASGTYVARLATPGAIRSRTLMLAK